MTNAVHKVHNEPMTKTQKSWYTEQGTDERPSSIPGHVDLYRCGKFIATVKA